MYKRSLHEERIQKNTIIDNAPKILKNRPTIKEETELSNSGPALKYKAGHFKF